MSGKMKNTLFNYFTKVSDKQGNENKMSVSHVSPPKHAVNNKKQNGSAFKSNKPTSSEKLKKPTKRVRVKHSDDDEEVLAKKREMKKRKRIIYDDSGSDDDWQAEENAQEMESSEDENLENEAVDSEDSSTSSLHESPKQRKKVTENKESNAATTKIVTTEEKVNRANSKNSHGRQWIHLTLNFLQKDKIRDAERRRPDHPDYNPRTLYVPPEYMRNLTPTMQQWWTIKSQNFDCVIFMKLGKFYELYHMDAVIGVQELNLVYMKHPETAHSGFPEATHARFFNMLVEKGYKVARVEQTETPEMMQNRIKQMCGPTKFDKVVRREVCQIATKGTRMYLAIEGDASSAESSYLLSITEKKVGTGSDSHSHFGICFVDTSRGAICMGQFEDDRHNSELRTLLAHYPPAHVLLNKSLCDDTRKTVMCMVGSAYIDQLATNTEFLDATQTLKMIHENKYFQLMDENKETDWPEILVNATEFKDLRTPKDEFELALSAFGACLWYLHRCKLDIQVLCVKNIKLYTVHCTDAPITSSSTLQAQHMASTIERLLTLNAKVLDATTLINLEVVNSCERDKQENSLLEKIDHCSTAFGNRLLRQWLCSPLCSVPAIVKRQQAVTSLMAMPDKVEQARKLLKKLPDIERLLMRIAVYGNITTSKKHPDSRAIFYEDFSKKKIENLLALLKGFKSSLDIVELFNDCDESDENYSELLLKITTTKNDNPIGEFPDLKPLLKFFEGAFNPQEALKTGKLIPKKGADLEFEAFDDKFQEIETKLKMHLKEVKKIFGCDVTYVGRDKKRYQIEVPEARARKAPSNFALSGGRKGFKRYYSPESKELLAKMQTIEEEKKEHLLDLNRRMFARFASSADKWIAAMKCLATLDVLISFAKYGNGEETCIPKIKVPTKEVPSSINIVNGRLATTKLTDFIPNDTSIGTDGENVMVLSGPNMGGKSTVMRQIGLIVILAQIGCPVPAEECELTVVDRIFTRLGAQDNIVAGQSTFFVEMSETASILKHATCHSLVFLDELGRGTTTFDGAAIAYAVLEHLIKKRCSTIFSTHYHFLVDKFSKYPQVKLVHMACLEEDDDDGKENDITVKTVTFLYKLTPGSCPSSHGYNAARLAGLPSQVVRKAQQQALLLQSYSKKVEIFQKLVTLPSNSLAEFKSLMSLYQKCQF